MLWVDKHRPTKLEKCDYHKELSDRLAKLVCLCTTNLQLHCSDPHFFAIMQASKADIPHMMFYGCSGAGKKTRVMAFLRAVFGPGVEKVGACALFV